MLNDNCGYDEIIRMALEVMEKAYSPYSDIKVGTAILCASGRIYTGCNIENASYGLSICAERVAVGCAVKSGDTDFKAIAVFNSTDKVFMPCGACRQVLMEFSPGIEIIAGSGANEIRRCNLNDIFPDPFSLRD